MFKKHKQLIIGFLLGAMLFSIVPVGATVQEYLLKKSEAKLLLDGKEFANTELPVLIYKGYNYIPAATFREICDTIGVGFEYINDTKEIQIIINRNTNQKKSSNETTSDIIEDGYNLTRISGVEYIRCTEIQDKHLAQGYDIDYVPKTQNYFFYRVNQSLKQNSEVEILLNNIPIQIFLDRAYVEYQYFKENILPLIK